MGMVKYSSSKDQMYKRNFDALHMSFKIPKRNKKETVSIKDNPTPNQEKTMNEKEKDAIKGDSKLTSSDPARNSNFKDLASQPTTWGSKSNVKTWNNYSTKQASWENSSVSKRWGQSTSTEQSSWGNNQVSKGWGSNAKIKKRKNKKRQKMSPYSPFHGLDSRSGFAEQNQQYQKGSNRSTSLKAEKLSF